MPPQAIQGPMPNPGIAAKGSTETAVYWLFSEADKLLYVGISRNPMARWAEHAQTSWWAQVSRFAVKWYPTRRAALRVELRTIHDDTPAYNVLGTPRSEMGIAMAAFFQSARSAEKGTRRPWDA
ncbi:GIY-YIG nuclease family protein [Streptomyces sp. NBC_00649]|uniref:GIY-YIG nuclease family protein n=1 Tax=Streptomyces sp. NBC_00649 TaxID=2975798 RepID=UPI00386DBA05